MHDKNSNRKSNAYNSNEYQHVQSVNIEPLSPEEALEFHINRMGEEYTDSTVRSHKSRLQYFIQFCDQERIENLNDLSGRDILLYRTWRRNQNGKGDGPISDATLKTALDTLRVYLKTAVRADGVHPQLPEQIDPPTLSKEAASRDVMLSSDRASEIIEYLRKYEYATVLHAGFELIWHTGMRRGAARSIDLDDYYPDEQYIQLKHRPESDTPLKNKKDGERPVAISKDLCTILNDWIDTHRPDVEDDYGRQPLLATKHGRPHAMTVQKYAYTATRPCAVGQECPHDKDPETCDAAIRKQDASKCPSSVSTHALRRGVLTQWLYQDWQVEHVSDRADVSPTVLEKHYDQRSDLEKMEQRRQNLNNI